MRNLNADELLRAVEDTLQPLIVGEGGTLDIATDPDAAIQLLFVSPPRWRVILGWPGYGSHQSAILGMASYRIYAIVQGCKGLPVRPAETLHRSGVNGATSLMRRIEQVSSWVRALRFPDGCGVDCKGFALDGSAWLDVEGVETRQHQLDFSIDAALPFSASVLPVSLEPCADAQTEH